MRPPLLTAAYKDFKPIHEIVSFPIGSEYGDKLCVPIEIIDDDYVEKFEYFHVHVKIVDQNAWFIPPFDYFSVHIYDDDCKKDYSLPPFPSLPLTPYSLLCSGVCVLC